MCHLLRSSLAGMFLVIPAGCSMLVSTSSGRPGAPILEIHDSSQSVEVVHRLDAGETPATASLEISELKPGQHVRLVTIVSSDVPSGGEFSTESCDACVMSHRTTVIAGTIRSVDQEGLVLTDVVALSNRNVAVPMISKVPYLSRLYKNSYDLVISSSAVPGEVRLNRRAILHIAEIGNADWAMYQQGHVVERIGVDFDFELTSE